MPEHITSKKTYYLVCIALLTLTFSTWRIAYVDLGRWNMIVALLISISKTALVGAFFMHLRWSASIMRLVVFAALFWFAILITLTLGDVLTRNTVSQPQPWQTSSTIMQPVTASARRYSVLSIGQTRIR